ncbi:MAG: ABC transporter ATP-binding protein [Spirochaetales bacterium]|nr:MAG: ABC transporter ATP-binding protein [Spirochaetales bacterium]
MVGFASGQPRHVRLRRRLSLPRVSSLHEAGFIMMRALTVDHVSKVFPAVKALDDVTMEIPRGSVYGVLGPNGAGKTTLFSVIAGFLRPTRGSVTIGDLPPGVIPLGRIGVLPQDALFQSNIPIIDQLLYFLKLLGFSRKQSLLELGRVMDLVGLTSVYYREAATLSHGMYKRLALAQAFLGKPDILILDEPTAGLDVVTAREIRESIKRSRGLATILVSSHNMSEMQELCDHVAVLNRGTIVSIGPVNEVAGSALSVSMTLNRELTEEELASFRGLAGDGALTGSAEIIRTDPMVYRILFPVHLSPEEADATMRELQKLLLSWNILLRSVQEDNRIENLYRRATTPNKSE